VKALYWNSLTNASFKLVNVYNGDEQCGQNQTFLGENAAQAEYQRRLARSKNLPRHLILSYRNVVVYKCA
jgi:hypothetical protein